MFSAPVYFNGINSENNYLLVWIIIIIVHGTIIIDYEYNPRRFADEVIVILLVK